MKKGKGGEREEREDLNRGKGMTRARGKENWKVEREGKTKEH